MGKKFDDFITNLNIKARIIISLTILVIGIVLFVVALYAKDGSILILVALFVLLLFVASIILFASNKHINTETQSNNIDNSESPLPVKKAVTLFRGTSINKMPDDYVVIDIETTGLDFANDRIVEISAVKYVNNEQVDILSSLIDPTVSIPDEASKINKITDDMVEDAPLFADYIDSVKDLIGDLPLVGHNIVKFDIMFLNAELARCDKEQITNDLVDTLKFVRRQFSLESYKLSDITRTLKLENKCKHRALDDCYCTNSLYQFLKKNKD